MKIKSFFTKKKIIWGSIILVLLIVIFAFFLRGGGNKTIETAKVERKNIEKTVLTTGQVISSTDLDLSFQSSGIVRRINVKEGDKVSVGQTLAVLDQSNASASLESAKAALAQAQANYDKVKAAATQTEIAVSQSAVDSAQVTLENARQTLFNKLSDAYRTSNTEVLASTNQIFSNPQSSFPQFSVPGTIQTNAQAVSKINSDRVTINQMFLTWGSEVDSLNDNNLEQVVNDSLSNLKKLSDYFGDIISILTIDTQVTVGGSQSNITTYQTSVSSSKSTVDTLYNTIVSDVQAVKNAQYALAQAQASLQLKKAPARPEDVNIALAQVLSAEGQLRVAQTALNNTVITAPTSGTITEVNIKLGEQATMGAGVIKLINTNELHTEAQVSESDIASINVGQKIDYTFDAFGPDQHFEGEVLTINPASTLVSGVVNYKVTGNLKDIPGIKPGMTVNMTVLVAEKNDVVSIPSSAIINKDGKKVVRIIDNPDDKTYHEVSIETGLQGDGGDVEVLSGLSVDQEVVTYIK